MTLSEDERRVLAVWGADCAERTLTLFEAAAPADRRPRDAIDGVRAFARGERRIGELRSLAVAAHAAARSVGAADAVAAARAAGHAAAVAHMGMHVRGASAYALRALALAGGDRAVVEDEARVQFDLASPEARAALHRLPPPRPSGGVLGPLFAGLQARIDGTVGQPG